MKKSYLIINLAAFSLAMMPLYSTIHAYTFDSSTVIARGERGEEGGSSGGFRGSPEEQNDVRAGGRAGTYHPAGYQRGYENANENNQNYNNSGYGNNQFPTYVPPQQPQNLGPTTNPDQQPY